MLNNFKERANFIWGIADLLRGDYKQSEYGRIILPLTVLRRLDCVLEPTKGTVLAHLPKVKGLSPEASEEVLKHKAKLSFYNRSKYDFPKLSADPNDIASNLRNYINGFSKNARNILEHFNFDDHIERLAQQTVFVNLSQSKKKGKEGIKEIEEGEKLQKQIKAMLLSLDAVEIYKNRGKFVETINRKVAELDLKIKAPVMNAILSALSERDATADVCLDKDGKPEPDADLRDNENIPLADNIEGYFQREVLPHLPDAWMDRSKDKIGYEINFTKEFYQYKPLRSLEDIRRDILALEKETEGMLKEILE